MAEIPNLAGVATKELVERIGTGSYKADYINWARTFNLLHQYAPGWYLELITAPDGGAVWRAPGNGGYLLLRFCHVDGTCLAGIPQSIMDNRNAPIAFDKISSRDITDTHRRGGCMAAAMTFGLGHELWAKMPLESGYGSSEEAPGRPAPAIVTSDETSTAKAVTMPASGGEKTMQDFLEAALDKGLTTYAADALLEKVGTNYASGIKTLALKDDAWVQEQNAINEQKAVPKSSARRKTAKAEPEDY